MVWLLLPLSGWAGSLLVSKVSYCLSVLLSPRAKKNYLVGLQGEALKIKIAAPPVDGAANEALIKYLSGILGLNQKQLSLLAGHSSRRKIVKIEDLAEDEVWHLLNKEMK